MLQKSKRKKRQLKSKDNEVNDSGKGSNIDSGKGANEGFRHDVRFLQEQIMRQNQMIAEFRNDLNSNKLEEKRRDQAKNLDKAKFELDKILGETERVRARYDEIKYMPYQSNYSYKEDMAQYQSMQMKMMDFIAETGNAISNMSIRPSEREKMLEKLSSSRNPEIKPESERLKNVPLSDSTRLPDSQATNRADLLTTRRGDESGRTPGSRHEQLLAKQNTGLSGATHRSGSKHRSPAKLNEVKERTEISQRESIGPQGEKNASVKGDENEKKESFQQESGSDKKKGLKNTSSIDSINGNAVEKNSPRGEQKSSSTLNSGKEGKLNLKLVKVDSKVADPIVEKSLKKEIASKVKSKVKLDPPLPKQESRKNHKLMPNSEMIVISMNGANHLPDQSHFSKIYAYIVDTKTGQISQPGWQKTSSPKSDILSPSYQLTFMPILLPTSMIMVYFLEIDSDLEQPCSNLVGFSFINPWLGNPGDSIVDVGNLRFPIYFPQYSAFEPGMLAKMQADYDLKKILGSDLEVIIAVMPSNTTPDEYASQLVDARLAFAFDDVYLRRVDIEPELCRRANQREKISMTSLVENASMFKKQISSVTLFKSLQFKKGEDLYEAIDKYVSIENCIGYAETMNYFQLKETTKYTIAIDCLFNITRQSLFSVAMIPVWKDEGADLDSVEIFWDIKRESPMKVLDFDSAAEFHTTDTEKIHKLSFMVILVLRIEYKSEEDIKVNQQGFSIVPVRTPENVFVHGTFQTPLFKDLLEKDTMALLSKIDIWSIIDATTKVTEEGSEVAKIRKDTSSIILRAYPEELHELYLDEQNTLMTNLMFMNEDASHEIIFNEKNRDIFRNQEPLYEKFIPNDFLAQAVVNQVTKYIQKTLGGEESDNSDDNDSSPDSQKSPKTSKSPNSPTSVKSKRKTGGFKRLSKVTVNQID